MAQQYGVAKGLIDWAKDKYNKVESGLGTIDKMRKSTFGIKNKKNDDPWHDSMVQKENASFRKQAQDKRKVGGASKQKTPPKQGLRKKSVTKKMATKR